MDLSISPIVITKLRVPALRSGLISRAHLINPHPSAGVVNLTLVCAPVGYGKTTLLVEAAQSLIQSGTAVAWYALDPSDDDPLPFRSYLIASLLQALGPISGLTQAAQHLRASPEIDWQRILPVIINAIVLSEKNCTLILDDYHLITSPAIHSALAYILDHQPENLRVMIGSRSDPPLPLARLRARGQLQEVRASNLRFTFDETALFLNEVMKLKLSSQGVAVLGERTEGWVTGLQLAAISLSGQADREQVIASFRGSHRYLVEYLMEEVVNRQSDRTQSFLLATSILDRLSAPLADAIVGGPSLPQTLQSAEILRQLVQTNLFVVALDDQGEWYRYHHLFRDFLQTRLDKLQPGQRFRLHRLACEWFAANGFYRDAASHAFQTQDWEYAAVFVEQQNFNLIIHGDISTLYEWCSAFPEEVMQRHPMLCMLQGMALAYSFRPQNRDRVEARLKQAEALVPRIEEQIASGLFDMAAVVRTFLSMTPDPSADPHEVLATAQRMISATSEPGAGQFSGLLLMGYAYLALHEAQAAQDAFGTARQIALQERLYFGIIESTFHLANLAYSQGQLQKAVAICRQAQAEIATILPDPEHALPALGSLDIVLGSVFLEQNQLEGAERHLRHGLDLMGGGIIPYYLLASYVALFRLYVILDRAAEALEYLDRLDAVWPAVAFCTRGLRMTVLLRKAPENPATLSEAAAWTAEFSLILEETGKLPGLGPFGAADTYYLASLAWGQAQIALGQAHATIPYLTRQLEMASAHQLQKRVIELSLLEAQAKRAQGDEQGAWAALERAIPLALDQGYVRIFDQGPALTQLLIEAARAGIYPDDIGRILAAIGGPPESVSTRVGITASQATYSETGESLSERELQVLRLMAGGATNQEIALQLVITVGTVKSHINHILKKLNAHNRTEAVARARDAGLLRF